MAAGSLASLFVEAASTAARSKRRSRETPRAALEDQPELLAELHSEKVTREIERIRRGPTGADYAVQFVGCVMFGLIFAAATADKANPGGSPAGRFLILTVIAFFVTGQYMRRKWRRLRAMADALERERVRTIADA